jgi:hypothetical protein
MKSTHRRRLHKNSKKLNRRLQNIKTLNRRVYKNSKKLHRRRYSAGANFTESANLKNLHEDNVLNIQNFLSDADSVSLEKSESTSEEVFRDINLSVEESLNYLNKEYAKQYGIDHNVSNPKNTICLTFENIDFIHQPIFQLHTIPPCKQILFKGCHFPPNTLPRHVQNPALYNFSEEIIDINVITDVTKAILIGCILHDCYFLKDIKSEIFMNLCILKSENIEWLICVPIITLKGSHLKSPQKLIIISDKLFRRDHLTTQYLDLSHTEASVSEDTFDKGQYYNYGMNNFRNLHTLIIKDVDWFNIPGTLIRKLKVIDMTGSYKDKRYKEHNRYIPLKDYMKKKISTYASQNLIIIDNEYECDTNINCTEEMILAQEPKCKCTIS